MRGNLALMMALIASVPAAGHAMGPPQAAEGPSFRCTGALSPTETLICGDAELSAYDRAMSFAYSRKWHPKQVNWAGQAAWLRKRDACRQQRRCVLALYQEWVSDIDASAYYGAVHFRVGDGPSDGADLMLGSQSPTGEVRPLGDSGELLIRPMGGGWYLFKASANHFYDPHDGLGPNMSDSEARGLVHLDKGKGIFVDDPATPTSCAVAFTKLRNGDWELEETGNCSGLGSTLSGTYRK